ncbi:MAG: M28 family peptidase [Candidatus Obscuribacter sp.]|nr:M28 family peptidase [Candidatus Obscuribacter sp.]
MSGNLSLQSLLDKHIRTLSLAIGERHSKKPEALTRAKEYIVSEFEKTKLTVAVHEFEYSGQKFANIEAVIPGHALAAENIVVGAHYDSEDGTPGANDNGTGVAAILAIASDLSAYKPERTIRFVAFANEEARFFATDGMGSQVYAKQLKEQETKVFAMMSLETMGYFTAGAGSQKYPSELSGADLPDVGNFLAFVANKKSEPVLNQTIELFKMFSSVPAMGMALDEDVQGVSLSDHRSFWQQDYPAMMITDTAPFRYPFYHHAQDTPDKINMKVYKEAVLGLTATIAAMAQKAKV